MCVCVCVFVYLYVHQLCLYVRTCRPILIVAMETECCQRSPDSKRASLSLSLSLSLTFLSSSLTPFLFLYFSSILLSFLSLSPVAPFLSSLPSFIFLVSHRGFTLSVSLSLSFPPTPLFSVSSCLLSSLPHSFPPTSPSFLESAVQLTINTGTCN